MQLRIVLFGILVPVVAAPAGDGTWNRSGGGNWNSALSWQGAIPNGLGNSALFGPSLPNTSSLINVNIPVTLGELEFNNVHQLQLTGSGNFTFHDTDALSTIRSAGISTSHLVAVPVSVPNGNDLEVNVSAHNGLHLSHPLSGNGRLLKTNAGFLALSGNNFAWTGTIELSGGETSVSTANALGSASGSNGDATIIRQGGTLNFAGPITVATEKLILDGGNLRFSSPHSVNFNAPIEVTAPSFITRFQEGGGTGIFNGIITSAHDLWFGGGRSVLNNANNLSGRTFIDGAIVEVENPQALGSDPHVLLQRSGALQVDANLTAAIDEFNTQNSISGAATLTSANAEINLQRGRIAFTGAGGLAGASTLRKTGLSEVMLTNIGANSSADIRVERGRLRFDGAGGAGSAAGKTSIDSTMHAVIDVRNTTVYDTIRLNNSTGFNYGGALIASHSGDSFYGSTVAGDIDLGNIGSTVAGVTYLNLSGSIQGGSMTVGGDGAVVVTGNSNTYTGETAILPITSNLYASAGLILRDGGRLTTTSGVRVGRLGTFTINKQGTTVLSDSVADTIPIRLDGGALSMTGSYTQDSSETVGAVTLGSGNTSVEMRDIDIYPTPHQTTFTITSLHREPGATSVFYNLSGGPLGGTGATDPRIFISSPPVLTNGIIGGWAIAHDSDVSVESDFATYDSSTTHLGVRRLGAAGRPSQVEGASPADNVRAAGALNTLTQNTTINSLQFPPGSTALAFNLGGHTLNIATGGVLRNSMQNSFIVNGTLTAGGTMPDSELFIYVSGNQMTISAAIADNSAGPVSLVKSGPTELFLSGTNTYTGSTVINQGTLAIGAPASIPAGADLQIDGGTFESAFASPTPINIGQITLRNSGVLRSQNQATSAPVNADTYLLESGHIDTRLVGDGPIVKQTRGLVAMTGDNSGYSGDIEVIEGMLSAGYLPPNYDSIDPLGSGHVTVRPGGILLNNYGTLANDLTLDGGEIAAATENRAFSGDVHVTANSLVRTYDGLYHPSFTTGSTPSSGPAAQNITLSGPLTVDSDVTLSVFGPGTLQLTGASPPSLAAGSTLAIEGGALSVSANLISSANVAAVGSTLNFASGFVNEGQLDLHDATVNGNVTLSSNGSVVVEGSVVFNGDVQGSGDFTGNGAVTFNGAYSPGQSPASIVFDGDLRLGETATLRIEIGGHLPGDEHDQLSVAGTASLDGDLHLFLIEGFRPGDGEAFEIISAPEMHGAFDSIANTYLGGGLFFEIDYHQSGVSLISIQATPGDSDFDGDVDLTDLGTLATHYGASAGRAWPQGDFDEDGDVDLVDLGSLATHYGQGEAQAYADFESMIAVPEPSTVFAAVAFGVIALRRRADSMRKSKFRRDPSLSCDGLVEKRPHAACR